MGLNEAQKKERSEYLENYLVITECSQRKPYVFISYASDNWETVFKSAVVPIQKQYGLRVYADKAFDKVNDKWIVPMLRNVRGADVIVAFISQSYIESYACFLELLTAVNNRKPIVFVALQEQLRLGDTTDLPVVERGVKNEILSQGANISTNTNNMSNDIMRAMKSAFTSLSTLLEQDALSKYDISDAFINFFRDASINRKTINDLGAVRRTIKSVSSNVFDPSLITEPVKPATPVKQPEPQPVAQSVPQTAPEPIAQPVPQTTPEPITQPVSEPVVQPEPQIEPQTPPDYQWSDSKPASGIQQEDLQAASELAQKILTDGARAALQKADSSLAKLKEQSTKLKTETPEQTGDQNAENAQRARAWLTTPAHFAQIGLLAGILTLIFHFTIAMLAWPFCAIGVIYGLRGLKTANQKLAIVAIILNIVVLFL